MQAKGLTNFPLLFSQIGKFLDEVEVTSQKLKNDLEIAKRAYYTLVRVIYAGGNVGPCPDEKTIFGALR